MGNHSGYQRQLIIARFTRVEECMTAEMEAEAESDKAFRVGHMPDELRRLVIEFERLVAVALSRGFTRDDVENLYGLTDYDQNMMTRDRMSDAVVEAAINARDDCLFDALAALVPDELPTSQ